MTHFPHTRLRRLRSSSWIREMVAEYRLHPSDLILPLFITEGENIMQTIQTMPVNRYSVDLAVKQAEAAKEAGICAIAIFPVIDKSLKNDTANEAYNPNSLICRAIKEIKNHVPDIGIICDIALDPFTNHGHDGIVINGIVDNDETIKILCKQAIAYAQAGADILAPSDMMDGRIGAIRSTLDAASQHDIMLLSYSAKYASSFYGPFRDAVGSRSNIAGVDKRTYQMDFRNSAEALREIEQDIYEGADMVMVKPAMPYLDIIRDAAMQHKLPILAYQVSGEFACIYHASQANCFDFSNALLESLLAIKRSGARSIFCYAALEVARKLI
jgi:porphobilinogen synthase